MMLVDVYQFICQFTLTVVLAGGFNKS